MRCYSSQGPVGRVLCNVSTTDGFAHHHHHQSSPSYDITITLCEQEMAEGGAMGGGDGRGGVCVYS